MDITLLGLFILYPRTVSEDSPSADSPTGLVSLTPSVNLHRLQTCAYFYGP